MDRAIDTKVEEVSHTWTEPSTPGGGGEPYMDRAINTKVEEVSHT